MRRRRARSRRVPRWRGAATRIDAMAKRRTRERNVHTMDVDGPRTRSFSATSRQARRISCHACLLSRCPPRASTPQRIYTATLSTGQSCGLSTLGWTVHCPRDSPQDSCQIYCPPPMSRNFSKCRGTWRNFLNLQRDAAQNSKRTTRPSSLGRPRLHVRPQSFSPPASSTAGMRVHH